MAWILSKDPEGRRWAKPLGTALRGSCSQAAGLCPVSPKRLWEQPGSPQTMMPSSSSVLPRLGASFPLGPWPRSRRGGLEAEGRGGPPASAAARPRIRRLGRPPRAVREWACRRPGAPSQPWAHARARRGLWVVLSGAGAGALRGRGCCWLIAGPRRQRAGCRVTV